MKTWIQISRNHAGQQDGCSFLHQPSFRKATLEHQAALARIHDVLGELGIPTAVTVTGVNNFMKHRIDDIIKKSSKSSDFGSSDFGLLDFGGDFMTGKL